MYIINNYIMDAQKRKKQSLKVIISEAVMVLAVVAMVVVLAFMVSGYWLNSDFKVERQGMIQVSSVPTGADFDVDGESSWLQRTNTSKILTSGEHTVTLSKEGYDTWTKTVNISEGLLYRIHYPRLFLQDRESEKALSATGFKMATISPNNKLLLLINDTSEWRLVNLSSSTLEPKKLNLSKALPAVSLADGASVGLFTGQILDSDWDQNSSHLLLKIATDDKTEWLLVDIENPASSVNLSREFGVDFDNVKILDNSSHNLLAVQNGNLHKINVSDKSVSAVLVKDVVSFDHYEDEIAYSALAEDGSYTVGLIKTDGSEATKLESTSEPTRVAISKFYDDMFITTLSQSTVALYKKTDFTPVSNFELSFHPEAMEVGHNGEFITMYTGGQIATLDMEANAVREWSVEGESFNWLDNDMVYTVSGGDLIVYDFDGFNRRVLAHNVSNHFPATITEDKWLYYFSDGDIIREWLIPR